LIEVDPGSLILQEQLIDLARRSHGDRSREQALALANIVLEYRLGNQPQVQSRMIATNLSVERRFSEDELNREAKFLGEKIAGALNVPNKQLRLDGSKKRPAQCLLRTIAHALHFTKNGDSSTAGRRCPFRRPMRLTQRYSVLTYRLGLSENSCRSNIVGESAAKVADTHRRGP
jgi:hypothetical protein